MNDLIKHLTDHWLALRRFLALLARGNGRIVVSVPNVRDSPVWKSKVPDVQWCYVQVRRHGPHPFEILHPPQRGGSVDGHGPCGGACGQVAAKPLLFKLSILNRITGGALNDLRFQQYACVRQRDQD